MKNEPRYEPQGVARNICIIRNSRDPKETNLYAFTQARGFIHSCCSLLAVHATLSAVPADMFIPSVLSILNT